MELQKLIDQLRLNYVDKYIIEKNFPEDECDKNDISFSEIFWGLCLLFVITFALSRDVVTSIVIALVVILVYLVSKLLKGNNKTFVLFTFARDMHPWEIIEEMQIEGYRPATLREFLGWAFKNWDRKNIITTLGQIFHDSDGELYVPILKSNNERLCLDWFYDSWKGVYFLAVKN